MAQRNVVLLIDAENMPPALASAIIEEAMRHGDIFQRRIYGDFSQGTLRDWLEAAPRHALTACQTIAGASGKNGADVALVIDAMDLFHTTDADVFCLASCDGDFTQLAMRMRQGGKTFVGMGRPNASARFQAACDSFTVIYAPKEPAKPASPPTALAQAPASCRALKAEVLKRAFDSVLPLDDGRVELPQLMVALKAYQPGFAVKAYGYSQFWKLLEASGVELTDNNRKARLKMPRLKKVVDNGQEPRASASN